MTKEDYEIVSEQFRIEIDCIQDATTKQFCIDLLSAFADFFVGIPSASGRTHHPPDEHSKDGMIRHCKRVCFWVVNLCKEMDFDVNIRDSMLVAALFHDLGRMRQLRTGVYDKIGHGVIAWDLIKTHVHLIDYKESFQNIKKVMRYVKTHMHHWDKEAPMPETIDEHLFAVADYCASRNDIDTPFIRRVPK